MPPRTRTKPAPSTSPDLVAHDAVVRLPLDKVHPDPRNPRFELGDLTELTASIKDGGVRQPITVYPHPDRPAEWMVLFGHRRRQASIDAGETDIPGIVREDLDTDAARLVERLIENLDREDLTPVEEATAYEQLVLAGVKVPAIAKRTGRSAKEITGRRALMKLQEGTRAKIQARQITVEDAAALVAFAGDKAATKRLEEAAGTANWRWTLQQEKDRAARAAKRGKALVELRASGARIAESKDLPDGMWQHKVSALPDSPDRDAKVSWDDYEAACVQWHEEAHPEGHAAHVGEAGTVSWVCVDRSQHTGSSGGAVDPASSPSDPAEAAAERARIQADVEQRKADCATAAGIRKAWIDTYITGPAALDRAQEGAIAGLTARVLAQVYLEQGPNEIAGWVGVPPIDTGKAYDPKAADQQERQVQDAVAKLPGAAGLLAILAAEFETETLVKTFNWALDSSALARSGLARGWLTLLTGTLGYELTAWETEQLQAIDRHQLEHAPTGDDGEDDPDGDG